MSIIRFQWGQEALCWEDYTCRGKFWAAKAWLKYSSISNALHVHWVTWATRCFGYMTKEVMRKEGESTTMRIKRLKFRLAFDNASYEGKDIGVSRTRYKKKRKKKTNKKRQEKQNSSQATTVETQPCSFWLGCCGWRLCQFINSRSNYGVNALTNNVTSQRARVGILWLKRNHIKGCQGRGTRLRGDHATEACYVPRAHVIILWTYRHEVFLAQHHFHNWIPVNHECLEELWSVANCLGVLYNNSHSPWTGTVRDLDPVPT